MEDSTQIDAADEQSLDTIYTLLNDQCRRHAIECLSDREAPIPLRELGQAVGAQNTEVNPERGEKRAASTDAIITALHHQHLPKLADAGIIDYDTETRTVTSTRTEILSSVLDDSDSVR